MFLGIIHGIDAWTVRPKKLKSKKSKSKLCMAHGMTEGEKWHFSKEASLMTKEIPAEVVIEEHIQKVDPMVRASVKGMLEDYHDIFPSNLPCGPLLKPQLDHEIKTVLGKLHSTKVPIGSVTPRWKNYKDRWGSYWSRDESSQVQVHMVLLCSFC